MVVLHPRYDAILLKCLVVLGLIFLFTFSSGMTWQDVETLQVGITLKDRWAEVSFDEMYRLVDQATGEEISTPPGKHSFFVVENGIRIVNQTGSTVGVYRGPIYLEFDKNIDGQAVFTLQNAQHGEKYRGSLKIQQDSDNRIQTINIVTLDAYVRGVVPREMPASWGNYGGMAALKAQAVASRTYALYYQKQSRHNGYDLCDTQHCQVYGGKSCEADNTNRAVEETSGEILQYQGRIIAPYYHATNGGFTELAQNVWSEALPYIQSVHDPYDDPANPHNINHMVIHNHAKWQTSLSVSEIEQRLDLNNPGSGPINHIEIISIFPSGRVNELQVSLAGGDTLSYFKENTRIFLGLRSQLFRIRETLESRVWLSGRSSRLDQKESVSELEGKWVINASGEKRMLLGNTFSARGASKEIQVPQKSFIIEGNGWGHGIGMSQNGAYNRSRAGHDYQEILSFYYPGTVLSLK